MAALWLDGPPSGASLARPLVGGEPPGEGAIRMHEMAITESVVTAVSERLPGRPIARVALEIGALSGVVADAVRFCFDVCVAGSPLEGAILDIRETPGLARCDACGAEVALDFPVGVCSCGSTELVITSGRELRIVEVEVRADELRARERGVA